jgi:hypothetical protein
MIKGLLESVKRSISEFSPWIEGIENDHLCALGARFDHFRKEWVTVVSCFWEENQ